MNTMFSSRIAALLTGLLLAASVAAAQAPAPAAAAASVDAPAVARTAATTTPPDYVIGPDDVLVVAFWREQEMSGEVTVRPDGMISLPLLNDVPATGLTPDQLRLNLMEAASRFVEDSRATVVVKQINSRKVFITGQVGKPGPYALTAPTTVLQLIAMAGGLTEYADAKNVAVLRTERGRSTSYRLNYQEVARRKKLQQNIELKPGDTVIVP